MRVPCRKADVRVSAAQWNVDALVAADGADPVPCLFSAAPSYATFLSPCEGLS